MKNGKQKAGWLMAGAMLWLAPGAFAACTDTPQTAPTSSTVCMSLTGAGSNVMANVYVGPYSAQINNGTTTNVICDDFFDDSFIPEYWTADVYQGGNTADYASTRNAQRTGLTGLALTQAYNEVGYLANLLLSTSNQTAIAEIHFALWSIFDPDPGSPSHPGALAYLDNYFGGTAASHSTQYNNALAILNSALAYQNDSSYISQFTIYSPDTNYDVTCAGQNCGKTKPPQEFLVKTPEPPVIALLGLDLSGVGALLFALRRRRAARS